MLGVALITAAVFLYIGLLVALCGWACMGGE